MDQQGFRSLLQGRNVPEENIEPALALAARFDAYFSGKPACADFLSASLRTLPTRYFLGARRKYKRAADMDEYLRQRKEELVAQLEACRFAIRLPAEATPA